MIRGLMYIELKTGYSDDGPAWIGYVKTFLLVAETDNKLMGYISVQKAD